jgi:hypothetical protein
MVECKSLECVGTREETLVALYLTLQKSPNDLPILLQYAKEKILPTQENLEEKTKEFLAGFNEENFLTTQLKEVVKLEIQ